MPESGTIDITDLVEQMRADFVKTETALIMVAASTNPATAWIALPIPAIFTRPIITFALDFSSKAAVMQAFFLNTAIRKSSQAADYVDSIRKRKSLPPTATEEEYLNAEIAQASEFVKWAVLTN